MISKEAIQKLRNEIGLRSGPVLSLYLATNPASRDVLDYSASGKRKPFVIRAKDTLKALAVPEAIASRVIDRLEHDVIRGRTRAVFATEDELEVYDLNVDLPVVNLPHGEVLARWGEPYVLPLVLALDEYERYAVVLLDEERWRLFEVYLNDVREVADAFRAVAPETWRKLSESKPATPMGLGARGTTARGGMGRDRFDRRVLAWTHRFYRQLAGELEGWLERLGAERLILMGVPEETRYFEELLPRAVRERVVAHLPMPAGGSKVDASEVLALTEAAIEEAERRKEAELLDRIREEGVWGTENVLEALQQGRVYVLVMPWHPEGRVWRCPDTGYAALARERAEAVCPGAAEEADLAETLVELAGLFGARVEFVRGDNADRLEREFGGLAGLKRW
ncbi:VLRF1 family aeRF1-type release factor [Oceanithermus desulfurans]|uniref:Peptide chain release factor 3 n=2 Tax=Oceanithermus desulfurans TaxID=227924 RepID=A0A511RHU8_9DEIN|nr:VLRF1 family aeRF1-type release factor [Oceanithermus desulfurans]MBB6029144.1 hypothetical protein [Oceanithermus desulfurans]GEM89218.1 peptide chain release factor 3 [Oceanithermus desulfurans NBRC 100063]